VGVLEKTKRDDERLRKELENADIEKFKEKLKLALSPTRRLKRRKSK